MDYTQIITAVITLLVAIADAFLVPYLKTKYSQAKLTKALTYVGIAVKAAEQLYDAADGEEKKQYVIEYLDTLGIKFDEQTIDVAIESAVLELHKKLSE